jgi:hypothetical protein
MNECKPLHMGGGGGGGGGDDDDADDDGRLGLMGGGARSDNAV